MKNQHGFTLIELIIIIIIAGVLSYVALVKFNDSDPRLQYETLIQKMASDVRYARQLALSENKSTRVYIDQTNNRYYLKWEDGTFIKTPVGSEDFIVQLGTGEFRDVQITSTAFTGGRLDFNTKGSPLNAGVAFSGNLNLVTLNNVKKIVVTANTGFLSIEDL